VRVFGGWTRSSSKTDWTRAAGIANAIFVFVTFLVSLPALAMPMSRTWLKLQAWLTVCCSIFTLVLGLFIWFHTLKTRSNLSTVWGQQTSSVQDLLQTRVRTLSTFFGGLV